ncbi:MAG: hypothetical protein OXE99_07410, partial [Cellvibrionales bacterium]|nr:hypothetical protein [Cellvibrionales bacterium]
MIHFHCLNALGLALILLSGCSAPVSNQTEGETPKQSVGNTYENLGTSPLNTATLNTTDTPEALEFSNIPKGEFTLKGLRKAL